jgi:hypothetical protein
LLLVAGCSLWYEPLEEPSELPTIAPGARSTTLEIVFVHLPSELPDAEAIWQEVDEQHLSPEFRQRLAENGIRCGLSGSQLPPALQELLMQPDISGTAVTDPLYTVNVRRIALPPGESREILTSSTRPQMIVLYNNGNSIEGAIREQAQGVLRVRCRMDGPRQTVLSLVPEIHHGPARSHYEPHQGALQLSVRREIETFEPLTIQSPLASGQHLLITCSDPPKGLGANLFAETGKDASYRQLLLIRLAGLPASELFPAESPLGPVADDWD